MLSAKPVEVYAIFGGRFGTYAEGQWSEFDQARVTEDVTQSFHEGTGSLHPFDGETNYTKPVEHAEGKGFGSTEAARGAAVGPDRDRGQQDQELPRPRGTSAPVAQVRDQRNGVILTTSKPGENVAQQDPAICTVDVSAAEIEGPGSEFH